MLIGLRKFAEKPAIISELIIAKFMNTGDKLLH
jgi:hypothetical protein